MDILLRHWQAAVYIAVALVSLVVLWKPLLWLIGVRIIPDNSIGVLTKKFVLLARASRLPDGRIIALRGEAGFQADTLAPGLHTGLWPWQYDVRVVKFFIVPPGKVGCVEACDGQPLPSGRIIADQVECDSYQDARAFLEKGGQRGPQMGLIAPGTYRVSPLLFSVRAAIRAALLEYNVGAVDTLIGDIAPPEELMKTLTDRKLAKQERVTYETQRQAQEVRQQLEQATALAATQAKVVDAERQVAIAEFNARAEVKSATGQAQSKKINAEADATMLQMVGEAEAGKVQAVGSAEAEVIKLKIASMESGNYAMVQVAEALAKAGVKLVPDIVAGAGVNGGSTLVDVLLANVIRDNGAKRIEHAS